MLTSLQNPLVKSIRKLHQARARRSQGQFLLEGTHLIQEALATNYPLQVVCYTPAWEQAHGDLALALGQRAERVEPVSEAVLDSMATTQHPDGVVAVAPATAVQLRGGRRRLAVPGGAEEAAPHACFRSFHPCAGRVGL